MSMTDINKSILQTILQYIDAGIHVIDRNGITMMYNDTMAKLEGLEKESVLNENILDIFPSLDEDTSTLLTVMKTGRPIIERTQMYVNYKGEKITTINTTIPIFKDDEKIGALEIAKNITDIKKLSEQVIDLQQELIGKNKEDAKPRVPLYTFDNIIGNSPEIKKSIDIAKKASKSHSSVLIFGETGTGKELFAQSIHYGSERRNMPFIAQNCAALPESLLEGILFGTVKGGFTGAIDRPGLFEQANGGTLLLDEINSMGLALQAKLLRVLQEGYIRRVGGLKDIPVDVRIIATTNEEPLDIIKSGRLRKDLYYRINVMYVRIPLLRERKEDINLLCEHFIGKYNRILKKNVKMVSKEVYNLFNEYQWPGNIRELENMIEGAINYISSDGTTIKKEHLPVHLETFGIKGPANGNSMEINDDFDKPLPNVLNDIEKEMLIKALNLSNNNISEAARILQIKRQTLQHKMKKFEIDK